MLLLWFLEKVSRSCSEDGSWKHPCLLFPASADCRPPAVSVSKVFLCCRILQETLNLVVCCHNDKENSSTSNIWSQTGTEHVFLQTGSDITCRWRSDRNVSEAHRNERWGVKQNIHKVDLPTRHRWSTLTSEGFKKGSTGWPAGLKSSRTWRSFWCQLETLWSEVLHRSEVSSVVGLNFEH